MNGIIAALFVLMMFVLTGIGMEYERADSTVYIQPIPCPDGIDGCLVYHSATDEISFEEGMKKQDSLWNIIQAFNVLILNYYILPKKDFEKTTHDGFIKEGTEIYIKK